MSSCVLEVQLRLSRCVHYNNLFNNNLFSKSPEHTHTPQCNELLAISYGSSTKYKRLTCRCRKTHAGRPLAHLGHVQYPWCGGARGGMRLCDAPRDGVVCTTYDMHARVQSASTSRYGCS